MPWPARELELIRPRLVVPLDATRSSTSAGREDRRGPGSCSTDLFPLYHPAAAIYNVALRETLFADARALGRTR